MLNICFFFKLEVILSISSLINHPLATPSVIYMWTSSICGIWLGRQRLRPHIRLINHRQTSTRFPGRSGWHETLRSTSLYSSVSLLNRNGESSDYRIPNVYISSYCLPHLKNIWNSRLWIWQKYFPLLLFLLSPNNLLDG